MAQTKNRGRFGSRIGRPTKKMLEDLDKEKSFRLTPVLYLGEAMHQDVRTVDPETVADFEACTVDEDLPLAQWLTAMIRETGNPFLFKVDGVVVKMGGQSLIPHDKTGERSGREWTEIPQDYI